MPLPLVLSMEALSTSTIQWSLMRDFLDRTSPIVWTFWIHILEMEDSKTILAIFVSQAVLSWQENVYLLLTARCFSGWNRKWLLKLPPSCDNLRSQIELYNCWYKYVISNIYCTHITVPPFGESELTQQYFQRYEHQFELFLKRKDWSRQVNK